MVWNGRNESIVGAKAVVNESGPVTATAAPSKEVDETCKRPPSSNITEKASEQVEEATTSAPTPAEPAPTKKNVWNGKHLRIMDIRDKSKESTPAAVAVSETSSVVSARSPSPAISSTSNASKKEIKEVVVTSSPKEIKTDEPLVQAKEDETTNSTSGSYTTNTTITADEDPALEVKVVTTVSSESEKKNKKKDGNNNSSSEEKKKSNASSTKKSPPTTVRSGINHNINSNKQKNNAKNASNGGSNASGNYARRSGNIKVGRGNNSNNGNHHSGNNNNGRYNNYSRGNSGGGSGKRRANNNVNNADKPLCAFFARGMCNRGTSCAFKHDPSQVGAFLEALPSSNPIRRSNTFPPVNHQGDNQTMNATAAVFVPTKRVFDPHKARAIQLAKDAQDHEDYSRFVSTAKIIRDEQKGEEKVNDPPIFSIDVECIATGYGSCAAGINDGCGNKGRNKEGIPSDQYNDRSHRYPGRVAMVDSEGNVLADIIIRPPNEGAGVVSYLTPLTGLTDDMCLGPDAKSLEEAMDIVKGLLPKDGVLVGQAIDHDVEWLGLTPGKDFERMVDIGEIFRQRIPSNLSQAANALKEKEAEGGDEQPSSDLSSDERIGFETRYRYFSLRHVCVNLLGEDIQSGVHNPIIDAKYSLVLFHKYRDSSVTQLRIVRDGLHRAPITPSFADENTPLIDGVCLRATGYQYKRSARKIWRWYSRRSASDVHS